MCKPAKGKAEPMPAGSLLPHPSSLATALPAPAACSTAHVGDGVPGVPDCSAADIPLVPTDGSGPPLGGVLTVRTYSFAACPQPGTPNCSISLHRCPSCHTLNTPLPLHLYCLTKAWGHALAATALAPVVNAVYSHLLLPPPPTPHEGPLFVLLKVCP